MKVGDKLICKPDDAPETAHSVRAVVVSVKGRKITICRALDFGKLRMKDVTWPVEKILEFYTPCDTFST